jgi:hypothetical protein
MACCAAAAHAASAPPPQKRSVPHVHVLTHRGVANEVDVRRVELDVVERITLIQSQEEAWWWWAYVCGEFARTFAHPPLPGIVCAHTIRVGVDVRALHRPVTQRGARRAIRADLRAGAGSQAQDGQANNKRDRDTAAAALRKETTHTSANTRHESTGAAPWRVHTHTHTHTNLVHAAGAIGTALGR